MMIYDLFMAPFVDFPFMRRALVGGIAVSLGAAPIGLFLMLRRMSLIGDAMAHAILPGAAIGFLIGGISLGAMTIGGLIAGLGVALLAGLVSRTTLVKEDMALAAFYLLSLALGVLILSGSGSNIDVLSLLFGSILALDDPTLLLIVSVSSLTLAALALGY
jgi:zinc/manganese transport system permease protein